MKIRTALLAAAAFFCASASANAAVIATLTDVTDNGGDYTFTYQGTLAGDAGLTTGSRLVIFDFLGYVDGSVFSPFANVLASTEAVSSGLLTVPGTVDDPNVANLVFTYNGADFRTSGGPFSQVDFSGFSARSVFGGLGRDVFAALTVKNNPAGEAGTLIYDTGSVTVPISAVPEPATWAMMIIGFGSAGAMIRRNRRREEGFVAA
jgi:hypothetical protein